MTTLVAFAVASAALVAVPGPNLVYIVTRSAVAGRRVGIASALGVETGTLVWIAGVALGLAGLIASSPIAFNAVKFAGKLNVLRSTSTTTMRWPCGTTRAASPRCSCSVADASLTVSSGCSPRTSCVSA